jgi:hypothetical protein
MTCTCSYRVAALFFALFAFVFAPGCAYVFFMAEQNSVVELRVPPSGTIIGETIRIIEPHFIAQMDHHPLYFAFFSKNSGNSSDELYFLGLVLEFNLRFLTAVQSSFIGPHVTNVQSMLEVPPMADNEVIGGPNNDTTLIKLDNNMTSKDQHRVIRWMKDFATDFRRDNPAFDKDVAVAVTGLGAMTHSLEAHAWRDMLTVAFVALVLGSLLPPWILHLDRIAAIRGLNTKSQQICRAYLRATVRGRRIAAVPLFTFSATRLLVSGAVLNFVGTITTCLVSLSTLWLVADATLMSAFAPILASLVTVPLSLAFFSVASDTAVHTMVLQRTVMDEKDAAHVDDPDAQPEVITDNARRSLHDTRALSGPDRSRSSISPAFPDRHLNTSQQRPSPADDQDSRAGSGDDHPDSGDGTVDSGYRIGFEHARCRTQYEEDELIYRKTRDAVAPWLVVTYVAALLFNGALWVIGVQIVSTAGCATCFAVAVHAAFTMVLLPYALALLYPSSALVKHSDPATVTDDLSPPPSPTRVAAANPAAFAQTAPVANAYQPNSPLSQSTNPLLGPSPPVTAPLHFSTRWGTRLLQRLFCSANVQGFPQTVASTLDGESDAAIAKRRRMALLRFAAVAMVRVLIITALFSAALYELGSARASVAFFDQVPRHSPEVVAGHRLLNAINPQTASPYFLVFKTGGPSGVYSDDVLAAANSMTFAATQQLGFNPAEVRTITQIEIWGIPLVVNAAWASILQGNADYAYLWKMTVDANAQYFQTVMFPNFDPLTDRAPVRAQETLDDIVSSFREQYGNLFEFIGWYGGNAPSWAAMTVVVAGMKQWFPIAVAMITAFNAVVWLRWGELGPTAQRTREITSAGGRSGRNRDPLAPKPSEATRCMKLACWRIGRSVLLGAGYSFFVSLCALMSVIMSMGLAVWIFEHGDVFWSQLWGILSDVDGISWLVIPIVIVAACVLAICTEIVEWFHLHDYHRRKETTSTRTARVSGAANISGQLSAHASAPPSLYAAQPTPSWEGGLDAEADERLSPRAPLVLRVCLGSIAVAYFTLGNADTMIMTEIGVILAFAIVAQTLIVGTLLRPLLADAMDALRRCL